MHSFTSGRKPSLEHSIGLTDFLREEDGEHEFDSRFHQQTQPSFGTGNHSAPQRLAEIKGRRDFRAHDHSGEAEKVGLKMRPTQLLIFGNPKGGTPLMLAAPSTAIDLPLKALVWEDADGKVWLSYNSPNSATAFQPNSKRTSQRLSLSWLRLLSTKTRDREGARATKRRTSNLLLLQSY